jgi:tetratricopeptide (TPR) repeat protein
VGCVGRFPGVDAMRLRITWVARLAMALPLLASAASDEVSLSADAWAKLDTFEAHTLGKADQVFTQGKAASDPVAAQRAFRDAYAKYDAFLLEFPKSKAQAYAVFRKARCLHLDDKRFKAVEAYEEVLDYFPDVVEFAAPALFQIGECHRQNGDMEKAMKAWLEIATDSDYRRHMLAAPAIMSLADNLTAQGKAAEAVPYYEQVADDFRVSNPWPARDAIGKVFTFYVRVRPDLDRLAEFYRKARSFEEHPRTVAKDADVTLDRLFWQRVWERIWQESRAFGNEESRKDDRKRFFRYWAKVFDGRFADWEDFQLHGANMELESSGDLDRWAKRMDEIFARWYKPGDLGRILTWIRYYKPLPKKIEEYLGKIELAKLKVDGCRAVVGTLSEIGQKGLARMAFTKAYETYDFGSLSNAEIEALAFLIVEALGDRPMGQNMIRKIRVFQMPDAEKARLATRIAKVDATGVRWVCLQFEDKDMGKNELLNFYHSVLKKPPEGLDPKEVIRERMELADYLTGVAEYAANAWWKKAEFLFFDKKYEQALASYRMADNPPDNLWKVVECFKGLGQVESAIGQLTEIENFFKAIAPRAAIEKAYVYRWARREKDEVSAFRTVLKKYPETGESSRAHNELEKKGINVKIGGGVDAQ